MKKVIIYWRIIMKKVISLLFVCLILTACGKKLYETIDTNQALEIINDGAMLLDVRTIEEYNREHIPNAINIPLDQIDTINYDKDTKIIVYCQTGVRSKEAVSKLADKGYTSLYNLDGGLLNWGGTLEE